MQLTKNYHVIGMMSGTSLDGIDLSLAKYYKKNKKWTFQMIACKTYAYNNSQVGLLKEFENQKLSYLEFKRKQLEYSQIIVEVINKFLNENKQKIANINIDAIGLHGHTIYHNPKENMTVQIGNPQFIAAQLRLNVVGNFRELDIHRGGEGAPLAPFGQQLFGDFIYLNFGGIANLGYRGQGHDIVFCNMVLNKYSQKIQNKLYDQNGEIGAQGIIDRVHLELLKKKFTNIDKHSLAREQIQGFLQEIEKSDLTKQELKNNMRTFYEFIEIQIIQSIISICGDIKGEKIEVYCTGGGAFNKFLMENLNRNKRNISFILPHPDIINFKQALIFGLLAVKFLQGQKNCSNGVGGQLVKGKYDGFDEI